MQINDTVFDSVRELDGIVVEIDEETGDAMVEWEAQDGRVFTEELAAFRFITQRSGEWEV